MKNNLISSFNTESEFIEEDPRRMALLVEIEAMIDQINRERTQYQTQLMKSEREVMDLKAKNNMQVCKKCTQRC
jgi:hypothetical protein